MNYRVLAVGVSDYADRGIRPLKPCDSEAQEVYRALCDPDYGFAKQSESILLISSDKGNLLSNRPTFEVHLKRLCELTESDEGLIVYFTGHGATVSGENYLVCADTRSEIIPNSALSLTGLFQYLRNSRAKYKIAILDCCKPGFLLGKSDAMRMAGEFQKVLDETRDEGLVVLASCKANQVSNLLHDESQSVFTHYLLRGLMGEIAPMPENAIITVKNLYDFVLDKVRKWSLDNKEQQVPYLGAEVTGGIEQIQIVKARPKPPGAETPTPFWKLEEVTFHGSLGFYYPTHVIEIRSSPYGDYGVLSLPSYAILGQSRQEVEIDQSAVSETDERANSQALQLIAQIGALLTRYYNSADLKQNEATRLEFPSGSASFSTLRFRDHIEVKYAVEISAPTKDNPILESIRSRFHWNALEVRVSLEPQKKTLASLIEFAKAKGWKVEEYLPSKHINLMIPAFGQRANAAKIRIELVDHQKLAVKYDLGSVDSANKVESLIAAAGMVLDLG